MTCATSDQQTSAVVEQFAQNYCDIRLKKTGVRSAFGNSKSFPNQTDDNEMLEKHEVMLKSGSSSKASDAYAGDGIVIALHVDHIVNITGLWRKLRLQSHRNSCLRCAKF